MELVLEFLRTNAEWIGMGFVILSVLLILTTIILSAVLRKRKKKLTTTTVSLYNAKKDLEDLEEKSATKISQLQATIDSKNDTVLRLEKTVSELKDDNRSSTETVKTLNERIADLEETVEELNKLLSSSKVALEAHEVARKELEDTHAKEIAKATKAFEESELHNADLVMQLKTEKAQAEKELQDVICQKLDMISTLEKELAESKKSCEALAVAIKAISALSPVKLPKDPAVKKSKKKEITRKELLVKAKEAGIKNVTKMTKEDLSAALKKVAKEKKKTEKEPAVDDNRE